MTDITITEGDTLEVDYEVENVGDGTGDQDIRLTVQDVLEDTDADVALDPGQTATGTLQWPTESGDEVTDALAEALTDDTSDSITVTVELPPPESAVSRYTFDNAETSGGNAIDTWGTNDAPITGATTGAAGANQNYTTNESYSFDGGDDYVNIPDFFDPATWGGYSVAVWLYTDVLDGKSHRAIDFRANHVGGLNIKTSNDLRAWHRDSSGNTQEVAFSLTTNTWTHVVATWDGSTLELYRDGTSVGDTSAPGTSSQNFTDTIGAFDAGPEDVWDGRLDDWRIYDRALTTTEVSNLYNSGDIRGK